MTNEEFLRALFGDDAPRVHVTSFRQDPSAPMSKEAHLKAWAGTYFSRGRLLPESNQYFTISTFRPDEEGRPRRRKALYLATHVIVLDDVREKLDVTAAQRLPAPTWVLETSLGSEQWGYLLERPCADRARVENLLDGLVASGLSPDGKDPGMKGVTRYVRLPEGINTKASKQVFGMPFKCRMKEWHPERRTTVEALALPFGIDLSAARRDTRVDGAADLPDHPLLQIEDVLCVKEVRSDGRFDVTCPWVSEHTGGTDDGAAVFTNADGTIGFKCHHGSCQSRTGRDLLRAIEEQAPGFAEKLASWQAMRAFNAITLGDGARVALADAIAAPPKEAPPPQVSVQDLVVPPREVSASAPSGLQALLELLRTHHPNSRQAKEAATELLRLADGLPAMEQIAWHTDVRDVMGWTKSNLTQILKELRRAWAKARPTIDSPEFLEGLMFVAELNQFYNWKTRAFLTVEGFTNAHLHEDPEVRKSALQDLKVVKVDRLDYAPGRERVFCEGGVTFGNMYFGDRHPHGVAGDCDQWLNHWDVLGWGGDIRKHMLQYMAFTILHPEQKINHMLLLGGKEGCGKDFLLYPLMMAMGADARVIEGDALTENYTGFLNGVKYLHINETDLGGRREALMIANKLKPFAAAPPETLRIREMYTKPFYVKNLVNCSMTTNSRLPLRLSESRRFFALWSPLQTRDQWGQVTLEWQDYWQAQWTWMKEEGGWEKCVWYLRNCVDLSDFRPGAPPRVTEFLQDIQESSKTPIQRTVDAFIEDKVGNFAADLVTAKEALDTLKAGELLAPELMQADHKAFTIHTLTCYFKEHGFHQFRGRKDGESVRVWCLREPLRFTIMAESAVMEAYQRERTKVIRSAALRAVTTSLEDNAARLWKDV